jgi:hypothetical protein
MKVPKSKTIRGRLRNGRPADLKSANRAHYQVWVEAKLNLRIVLLPKIRKIKLPLVNLSKTLGSLKSRTRHSYLVLLQPTLSASRWR